MSASSVPGGAGWAAAAAAVARRPRLWRAAAGQARRLAPSRWWARWPFLPLPDRRWLAFRMETQYGDPHHAPVAADVVAWLDWAAANRPANARRPRPGHR